MFVGLRACAEGCSKELPAVFFGPGSPPRGFRGMARDGRFLEQIVGLGPVPPRSQEGRERSYSGGTIAHLGILV